MTRLQQVRGHVLNAHGAGPEELSAGFAILSASIKRERLKRRALPYALCIVFLLFAGGARFGQSRAAEARIRGISVAEHYEEGQDRYYGHDFRPLDQYRERMAMYEVVLGTAAVAACGAACLAPLAVFFGRKRRQRAIEARILRIERQFAAGVARPTNASIDSKGEHS